MFPSSKISKTHCKTGPKATELPSSAKYASFWKRFVAFLIDVIFLSFVITIIKHVIEDVNIFWLTIVISWLYWAMMESSSLQATLGKVVLGIKVTDLKGEPVSFPRATGRYFGKFLIPIFILSMGSFMSSGEYTSPVDFLTKNKKQGLHDMLAGTLVVQKQDFYEPS